MMVKGLDFDDDRWEDPSVTGWLMLYCVWLMFEIVIGVWSVFQLPYVPEWAKTLGYLPYLLPAYSLLAVFLRFRDAVAASLVSLSIFIFSGIVNLIVFLTVDNITSAITVGLLGISVSFIWIVYFSRSKLVRVRFPKEERRLFAIDWILFILSIALCMILNLSTLGNLGNYKNNSSEEYRETIEAAKGLIGFNDRELHYVDCAIDGKYCSLFYSR